MLTKLSVLERVDAYFACQARIHRDVKPHRLAFTVIELVVTIGVIGVICCLLLPGVDAARRSARQAHIRSKLQNLGADMQWYHNLRNKYPTTTELADFAMQYDESFESNFDSDGNEILDAHYDYCYVVKSAEQYSFVLCALPKPPYDSGSAVFCINESGDMVDEPPDEAAEEVEQTRVVEVTLQLMDSAARVITMSDNPDDAAWVLPYLATIDPQTVLANLFDEDHNGAISALEVRAFATPHIGDSASAREVRSGLRRALATLQLDGDDYPDVRVTDMQGDPAVLFRASNLGLVHEAVVSKAGIANSLTAKITNAEIARLSGDLEECAEDINAAHNELRAQTGKSISRTDAILLDGLYRVLAPPPAP